MANLIGFQRSPIADIGLPVGPVGKPIIVYGFNVVAAVTAVSPAIQFYNDSDGSTNIIIQVDTAADVPSTVTFAEGIMFPSGCFLDVASANDVVQVTVFYTVAK